MSPDWGRHARENLVAVPTIRADLTIPDSRLPLVSVGYTLTFGSLLIVFGRVGDLFGRRRLFLIGLTIFTAASLATGLAQAEWQLITARAGQGIGAAMVSPTALALLTTAFGEGDMRNRALGYWGRGRLRRRRRRALLGDVLVERRSGHPLPFTLCSLLVRLAGLLESHRDDACFGI